MKRGSTSAKAGAARDALADLMADGCPTIAEAARRLGMSQTIADRHWQTLRRDLGEQAA